MNNAEVSREFLDESDDQVSTDVIDPDTASDVRAALSLRDADRIEAYVRGKIAKNIREQAFAMNADMLATLIEAARL